MGALIISGLKKDNQEPNTSPTEGSAETQLRGWHWISLVLLMVLFSAAIFVFLSDVNLGLADSPELIANKILELGYWGQVAIIGLMIVHCFVPFPAEFVALAAGMCFGVIHGTLLTWIGAMIGAMLSFGLTRFFGRPFVEWSLPKRQQHMLDQWTEDQGAATLLISRFIPIIAFNLINYAAGLTRVSWWTFAWTTGIGILPLTTLMVFMGDSMNHLSWPWLMGLSILGIIAMGVSHYFIRKRRHP